MSVTDLGINVDVIKLQPLSHSIWEQSDDWWNRDQKDFNKNVQRAVQMVPEHMFDSYMDSCGRIADLSHPEEAYTALTPDMIDSILPDILDEIPYTLVRGRWMLVNTQSSYTAHTDPSNRIHIPVLTSPNNQMLFYPNGLDALQNDVQSYHMKEGSVYHAETVKTHSFVNMSGYDPMQSFPYRIHLVFGIVE